jgi:aminoglycoside 3-N-acetyltransferase
MQFIENLTNEWREAGVSEGDLLLVHSNIKRTFRRGLKEGAKVTPTEILTSLINAVGTNGTLLIPLFNFDFAKGVPFDLRTTPSHMGALTEAARLHPLAIRTGHPMYSFAAIGANSSWFREINNFSGYGSDSPFAVLRQMKGKIGILDLSDQLSMTFYHHVEEMCSVDYRYHKTFTGKYKDEAGHTEERTYGLFVRDLARGIKTHVEPTGNQLWASGLYKGFKPNQGCGLRTVESNKLFDFVADIIKSGRAEGLLYEVSQDNK